MTPEDQLKKESPDRRAATVHAVAGQVAASQAVNGKVNLASAVQEAVLQTDAVAAKRRMVIGPNTALSYDAPLHIVRGEGSHLFDAEGVDYLDCCNNVAHVGHCHPKVATAVAQQLFTLNTNIRYLHEKLVLHAEKLTSTMPQALEVMYAVCSGSEANDLALRIAMANAGPGATHVAVMDGAYHGHTTATIQLSPYKFDGPGGEGRPAHVHVLPLPDEMRAQHLDGAEAARAAVAEAHAAGGKIAAFFCESIPSCAGQVIFPPGYLRDAYAVMHEEGALCIADEVQCGFGRIGSHFWAFETQNVVPDMVTLGKPIGNGFPMGAVVTNKHVANGFCTGMEYFNTCGGCTAAGAAGLAVLEVIEEEQLQKNAEEVGHYLLQQLKPLQKEYGCIGDVRGLGLFVGIETVTDSTSQQPAPAVCKWLKEQCKARRVLLSSDGLHNSVLKIKPPMCFSKADVDRALAALEDALQGGVPADIMKLDEAYNAAAEETRRKQRIGNTKM